MADTGGTGLPVQIIRYAGEAGTGVAVRDGAVVRPLPAGSVAELLTLSREELREMLRRPGEALPSRAPVRLLPPVDGLTEVWASGVTYERSSAARQEESQVADVYARVYAAERPELFFKSQAWRVCGTGEPIGIRPDSVISVPEPELALACNAAGEIVGVTICNDVSSRSIEGENPLYLPQAKVYPGACALGPGIVPAWELPDIGSLAITASVRRGERTVWHGETSTAKLHRSLDDLVTYLFRCASFPHGVILSTGTGLVPELDFSLLPADVVRIDIAGVGSLANVVRPATGEWFGWLTPEPDRAPGAAGPAGSAASAALAGGSDPARSDDG
jgi:2-dehydro-3-deoxy-D-arabinonate dehydratase